MKVTRRAIARMLAAAIPVAAAPQTTPDAGAKNARDQFDRNTQAMAAVKVPTATEPAFRFKA